MLAKCYTAEYRGLWCSDWEEERFGRLEGLEITPLVRPRQASSMMSGVKRKAETKSSCVLQWTEPASLPISPSPPQNIGSSSFPHQPPCIPSLRHVSSKLNFYLLCSLGMAGCETSCF
jgi:hypothetical protein